MEVGPTHQGPAGIGDKAHGDPPCGAGTGGAARPDVGLITAPINAREGATGQPTVAELQVALGRANDAVRRSERRFLDFAEAAGDWFWETDAELRVTFCSERFYEMLGLGADAVLGHSISQLGRRYAIDHGAWQEHVRDMAAHRPYEGFVFGWMTPSGREYRIRSSARPHTDDAGKFQGYRGVGRDITEEHRLADEARYRETHDALTGLVNRVAFEEGLAEALRGAQAHGRVHGLCYLDLDQFRVINDTAGHRAGDAVIRHVAELLQRNVRSGDTLARLGGDEFGLLLLDCNMTTVLDLAQRLVRKIGEDRFAWGSRTYDLGVSIGVVPVTAEAESTVSLLSQGDVACYTAKDLGRNRVHVYQSDVDGHARKRHTQLIHAADVQDALDSNRLQLYAQPIVAVGRGERKPRGYEVLLRLFRRDRVQIPTAEFIPAAERFGMMTAIDRWVIREALKGYMKAFPDGNGPYMNLNLSGKSFEDDHLAEFVTAEFEACGVSPERICFEITETAVIQNLQRASLFIETLRPSGCRFALDDFGSGFASFAYLKQLPVDILKIDGGFVRSMTDDPVDRAMVAALVSVGKVMGIKTVAESVENEETMVLLAEMGVDYAQGYALGRPRPLQEIAGVPIDRDV